MKCGFNGVEMKKAVIGTALLCLGTGNAFALGHGFDVNGLQINPTIQVSGQYDDNVTRAETQTTSSWVSIVRPDLDITAGSDINYINFGYVFERGEYYSSKNDSYSDHFVDAATHNEFSSKAMLDAALSYTRSHDARGSTFSGIITGFNTPDKWYETAANAKFSYGGQDATGRVVLDGGFAAKRYYNHRTLTAGRDMNTAEGGATFFYKVGAKTSAFVEGRYKVYDYRLATSLLDSSEVSTYAGLTWEATARTTGIAKFGWQRKKFKRGNQAAGNYFSYDLAVEWAPLTYSTWTLASGYKANETDGTGSYIKTNDVNLAWTHEWNERFSHTANVGYKRDNYVGAATARKDNYTMAGINLNYDLTSWLDVGADYAYTNRSSNVINADYKQNVFSVMVMGAF